MKLSYSFLAVAALGLVASPALAQGAPPAASAAPAVPPPSPALPAAALPPSAPPKTGDPAPAAPVPAAPTTPAAQDNWSQAIDKSRTHEALIYDDVRAQQALVADEAEFVAGPEKLRQRLRFFVGLGGGFQNYHRFFDPYSMPYDAQGSRINGVVVKPLGPIFHVSGGLRSTVARHLDLQARLSLSVAKTQGDMYISTTSTSSSSFNNYGSFNADSSGTVWGAELDGTVRWLPQLFGPRFFVGAGPVLEVASLNASPSGTMDGVPPFSINELIITAYGLLELGVIFGGQEEWEVALRGAAGVGANHNAEDAENLQLSIARAF